MANWSLFKNIINSRHNTIALNLQNIQSTKQIDLMIKYFSKLIIHAHAKSVPLHAIDKCKLINPPSNLLKIKQRNSIRRLWQRCRNNVTLKTTYKRLKNKIAADNENFRNSNWSNNLIKMNMDASKARLYKFVEILKSASAPVPLYLTISSCTQQKKKNVKFLRTISKQYTK